MVRWPRFKLRTLLILVACIAAVMGIATTYVSRCIVQRQNVASLEEIGCQFHAGQGSFACIQVWYSDDLRWNDGEERFVLSYGKTSSVYQWIKKTYGKDFLDYPVALEISCFGFHHEQWQVDPTLDQNMIDQIKKLSTVRQLCITKSLVVDGNIPSVTTNNSLKKHFPNLIISPVSNEMKLVPNTADNKGLDAEASKASFLND